MCSTRCFSEVESGVKLIVSVVCVGVRCEYEVKSECEREREQRRASGWLAPERASKELQLPHASPQ